MTQNIVYLYLRFYNKIIDVCIPIVANGVTVNSLGNSCKYFRSITITRSILVSIVTFVLSKTASKYLVQFH